MDEESQPEKSSQSLETLNTSFSSSLSNLTSSSRALPSNTDFHFYNNFNEFKLPVKQITHHSQSLLETLGSSTPHIFNNDNNNNNKTLQFPSSDLDLDTDGYDWLVNFNDEILERFDASIDEFKKRRDKEEELGRSLGLDRAASADNDDNDDGFQLVCGKKKKGVMSGGGGGGGESVVSGDSVVNYSSSSSGVKVVVKDKKAKVPFHIPTIKKPQEEYNILVNNANQPFGHVWLERSEDGTRFVHPLEKLSVLDFVDKDIGDAEPVQPPSIDCTPFKLVEEVKDLKALAAKLRSVNEFAVDLEHNQYRSFQGLTCLMQISTRTEDFVVDTLKLRIHVGPYLREIFKDPTKKKVMHGADRDIVWLQRDFGIYLCNMFDTGQASRVLKLERNSLEYLLHHFCGVTANKEYQNADWRLRPLPDEMLRYAREDTHYLLYIYDLMKIQLHSMPKESEQSDAPLVEVYKRSYDVCMQLYEKELLTENSYLYIYGLQGAGFNAQQLAIVAGLCEWRDVVARAEDESTGYILPNRTLIEIAKQLPVTASKLRRLLNSKHPYVERNLSSVVSIIRHSMRNASEFEAVSQQLKEGHVVTATEENFAVNDGSEVFSPVAPIKLKTVSARTESIVGGNAINGYLSAQLPPSPQLGSSIAELARDGQGGSFDHPGAKIESDSHTSELSRENLTISGQSSDTNSGTGMSSSAKVTGATVQVLKKPSRAFGALLGNSASKRKLDTDKKDKEQIKLDQIRSSVNFPFHSFLGQNEQSKAVVEEPNRVLKVSQPEEPPAMPAVRSNVEDFIMLEDDSNVEESIHGSSETTTTPREDKFVGSALDIDKEGEPMSLSDLSTSFQECFQLMNQNKKDGKVEKSQEPSGFLLKPFDYEAAREQVRFGEDPENESGGRGAKNESGLLDSGGRKKSSTLGRVQIDDVTREFAPGKRRQAFPATGNRSTTFR